MVAGIVGAAYVIWREEVRLGAAGGAAEQFEHQARLASRALLEIKSAQPGYIAAGQGEDFWISRVEALRASARETVTVLHSQARSARARSEVETASAAFEDFEQLDRRARDYARNGQRLLASDLVFSEGIEKIDAAVAALDLARDTELAEREAAVADRRRTQLLAAGMAAGVGLLIVLLLTPLRPSTDPVEVANPEAAEPAADYPISVRRDAPASSSPVTAPPAPAVTPPAAVVPPVVALPPAVVDPPAPPARSAVDLPAIAALCTDLGRVFDTRALPAVLERAANVLDAAGIVLWVCDPDGRELAPVFAHGYPQTLVARLGTIARDAENVTAAAFRTGVVQTVRSSAGSSGAIAAPLLTPSGPVGVMAAELRHDREQHEATRAAAAIIAAQLATLMGPPSSRSQSGAEAAGA
jgi:hypothetical protein